LGDIALRYGYTWDDIPYMMALNEMDETAVRELKIGAVFLVPPHDGTYTPTPGGATATPTASPTPDAPTETSTPTPTHTRTPMPTARIAVTAPGSVITQPPVTFTATTVPPTATPTPAAVAGVPQEPPPATRSVTPQDNRSPWLLVAVGLQMLLVLGAGIELVLRRFRR
jgi:hypothetical protein